MSQMMSNWSVVSHVGSRSKPFPFYLADSATLDGGIRELAERMAAEAAVSMVDILAESTRYKAIVCLIPSKRIRLFFEKRIYDVILPVFISLCSLEWFLTHGYDDCPREVIWSNHQGVGEYLKQVWPSEIVSLRCSYKVGIQDRFYSILLKLLRGIKRRVFGRVAQRMVETCSLDEVSSQPMIAVHYVEGVDIHRRSDLFWWQGSGIDASRILIYFDELSRINKKSAKTISNQLKRLGISWIDMPVEFNRSQFKKHHDVSGDLVSRWAHDSVQIESDNPLEKWLAVEADNLVSEIQYWFSFYRRFNVKINIDITDGTPLNVAKSIAGDLYDGIRIGRERSDSWGFDTMGIHPDHVYFAWNKRGADIVEANRNLVDARVITGFLYDAGWSMQKKEGQHLRRKLNCCGAEFVIALFDNNFGWSAVFSKSMMKEFYSAFLEWVVEDNRIGVITKSKKPVILEGLPELEDKMREAVSTGRWINLDDVEGRLPSDASHGSDFCVGIGISSAVTEAVAAGCKGIHCDISTKTAHPFYDWGYERVVFDDLNRLMCALKDYALDPQLVSGLGNFSDYMEHVDPFADGKSGERCGTYIRWLLDRIDMGESRESAINFANDQYYFSWGRDKILTVSNH